MQLPVEVPWNMVAVQRNDEKIKQAVWLVSCTLWAHTCSGFDLRTFSLTATMYLCLLYSWIKQWTCLFNLFGTSAWTTCELHYAYLLKLLSTQVVPCFANLSWILEKIEDGNHALYTHLNWIRDLTGSLDSISVTICCWCFALAFQLDSLLYQ